MIADGALTDDEVVGDGRRPPAVEQAGQHRPLTAGEQAEPRILGDGGQLLELGQHPGRVQLVRDPQHVRLQLRLAAGAGDAPGAGLAPDQRERHRGRDLLRDNRENSGNLVPLWFPGGQPDGKRDGALAHPGVLRGCEKTRRVRGVDSPQNRDADALLGRDPQERRHVLADAIDPPGAVEGTENHVPEPAHRRRRQPGEVSVAARRRRHRDHPDTRAVSIEGVDPHGEHLIRVLSAVASPDRLIAGEVAIGQGLEAHFAGVAFAR